MARGSVIIVSAQPNEKMTEGVIDDTSKPGMIVELTPNPAQVGGRPHFRAASHADGAKGPIAVLCPDWLQGKLTADAYVAGTRCFVYYPMAGDDLNLLLGDVVGTGDIVTMGDLFGVANGGKIKANSSFASAPFQAMESLSALTADTLLWVRYNGNQA